MLLQNDVDIDILKQTRKGISTRSTFDAVGGYFTHKPVIIMDLPLSLYTIRRKEVNARAGGVE